VQPFGGFKRNTDERRFQGLGSGGPGPIGVTLRSSVVLIDSGVEGLGFARKPARSRQESAVIGGAMDSALTAAQMPSG
jgi:hypothetical protein